ERHPADRHRAAQPAGTRRHRHRRATDDLHRRGNRQRGGQRDGRARAQPADHAAEGPRRTRGRTDGRDVVKPFAYVNPATAQEAVAALDAERGRAVPLAGGMDLVGLMKDFIVTPERVVNVKRLDSSIADLPEGGLRIGAATKLVELEAHPRVRREYPALAQAAGEVGTPQIRNLGTVCGNLLQRPRCWYFRNE